ncbi:peptide chain release factor N(5)-glutamine methyltransferase [Virgibacillus sp. C22-A2]|uniref:Release factor glutamine methyltransferase n=1 Tax=Virgibacillus tibetensis TaxID=3042313 RepID=A0ABU6KGM7_9BACI|nr:peptide chain release factor N(5)-glutamine methyltransferase [Virgibacillus sp. C22-A2]
MTTTKQYEVLQWASLFLEKHNREARVAEILLQHFLGVSRTNYYMGMREVIPERIIIPYKEAIRKHAETGVPVQHLIGKESFYGREFSVNEHVLVPRPETEELVQYVIQAVQQSKPSEPVSLVDIGTGSGVIAISLALELPNATVYATDISVQALSVAKNNAADLQADINFHQGDFLQPLIDKNIQADVVVSNPPYIPRTEEIALSDTVKNFDPELALFADDDGLAAYKKIIIQSQKVVKPNTILAFEIGHQQSESVTSLIKTAFPNSRVKTIQDINGKDRIVAAEL